VLKCLFDGLERFLTHLSGVSALWNQWVAIRNLTVTAEVAGSSPADWLHDGIRSGHGWAALMPAQSKIALRAFGADDMEKRHASGVDDTFDTLALQSIQWRHNVVTGGGITLHWVAA
jgi:hypothetical protein